MDFRRQTLSLISPNRDLAVVQLYVYLLRLSKCYIYEGVVHVGHCIHLLQKISMWSHGFSCALHVTDHLLSC